MSEGVLGNLKDRARALRGAQPDDEVVLSTGVRVRLKPVSSSLVEDLKAVITDPPVPVFFNPDKEREEENPSDPAYLAKLDQNNIKRAEAVLSALIEFGVELLDGLPEDDKWLRKLERLQKRHGLDLSGFDLADEYDREFLYKRYVVVAGADLATIGTLHGLRPLEVARARQLFLGDAARSGPGGVPAEGSHLDGD
jgi:hypothetical protein